MRSLNSTPEGADRARLVDAVRRSFTAALVRGEQRAAERTVREAMDADLDQATISDEIIAPALRYVGRLWEQGVITVADEHLASEISLRILALQREAYRVARDRSRQRVLMAAVEGERHVIGLGMAADLLLRAGFDVRFFGADLPLAALAPAVSAHDPAVFAFSATMPESGRSLRRAIEEVRRTDGSVAVLAGGPGVPEGLADQDWLAVTRHVSSVVDTVDALVRRPRLN